MTGKLKLLAVTLPLAGLFMAIAAVIVNNEMKEVQVQMEQGTNLSSYSRAMKRPVATVPSQKPSSSSSSATPSESVSEPSSSQAQPPVTAPSSTEDEAQTNASIAQSLAESFSKQGDEVHVMGGGN